MGEKLSPGRKKALSRLSETETQLIGTELTAAAWLVAKGLAVRHRFNRFSITEAGRLAQLRTRPAKENEGHG